MANSLAAFALVAEEFERSGDPIKGLKPLFAPILARERGSDFDPLKFATEFTAAYGLSMTPFVAGALAERLTSIGLLEQTQEHPLSKYRVASFEWSAKPIDENKIGRIVKLFCAWAAHRLNAAGRAFTDAQLEDAIFLRLGRPEFASAFMDGGGGKRTAKLRSLLGLGGIDANASDDSYLDYLVAEFVLTTANAAPELFEEISQVAYGSLIADAVAGLAAPENFQPSDPPLRIVLDAPLVLDLLDLNTIEHREYAADLLEMIRGMGFRVAVFSHSIDEMRATIRTTVSSHQRGIAFGPLADRLRTTPGYSAYAMTVSDSLDARMAELNISVLRSEIYDEARYEKFFPDERVDQVRNSIGDLHAHLDARIRDAKSVSTVARLKGERRHPTSVFDAGTIFVTRNSLLAKRVLKVLSLGRSEPDPRFTIATDGQLAGVLWFVRGIKGLELSRRRLIANCSSAVLPKQEVISRILKLLNDVEPRLGDEFVALMTDKRASLCPMRETSGVVDSIDQARSVEILELMKAELAEPYRQIAEDAEIKAVKMEAEIGRVESQSRDVITVLQESIEQVEVQKKAVELQFNQNFAQLSFDLDLARQERDAIRNERTAMIRARAERASSELRRLSALEGRAATILTCFGWLVAIVASLASILAPELVESISAKVVLAIVYLVSVPFVNVGIGNLTHWIVKRVMFSARRRYVASLLEGTDFNSQAESSERMLLEDK